MLSVLQCQKCQDQIFKLLAIASIAIMAGVFQWNKKQKTTEFDT